MKKNSKKRRILFATMATIIIGLFAAFAIYVSDYYHADNEAIANFVYSNPIEINHMEEGIIAYIPESPETGFIFYPGGKVEYTAYEPLMLACADQGILCILLEMPFNLAVLDMYAADGIKKLFPEINNWYIGGHSLGGSMAAGYLSKNIADFEGLILLGSYSTIDLSASNLNVLSICGSEDKVLNHENYENCKSNLPSDYVELIIPGGCHAFFGMYGNQDGDGVPNISNTEQIQKTANEISNFIGPFFNLLQFHNSNQ